MSYEPDQLPDDADLSLPPRLLADLAATQRNPVVPPTVNIAISRTAREHFARHRRIRVWRWASGIAAAAAVVLVAVWMSVLHPHSQGISANREAAPSPPMAADARAGRSALAEDIDRNGVVDVLDAFAVARGIKAHQTNPAWDVNGDGVVDQQDVDQIGTTAVRVKGGVQ